MIKIVMARLIVHTAKGPYIHRLPSGEVVAICMCGLSDKYPFCSGKHKLVQDEDANKVYTYDESGYKRLGEVNINLTGTRRV